MERRAKVELFEEIRREYEFGIGTVRLMGVARKLGVHRAAGRQALGRCTNRRRGSYARKAVPAGARRADAVH